MSLFCAIEKSSFIEKFMPKGKVASFKIVLVSFFVCVDEIYYSPESIDSKMMFGYFSKVARLIVDVII